MQLNRMLLVLVLGLIFILPGSTSAQSGNLLQFVEAQTRIFYRGQTLTLAQLNAIRSDTVATYCAQQISAESIKRGQSSEFRCFDTEAELTENRTQQLATVAQFTQQNGVSPAVACDHWAAYYNTGWNGLIADLCNGQRHGPNGGGGLYSLDKYGSPNYITVFLNGNYTGLPTDYYDRQWLLLPGLGAGFQSEQVH